tara:strand:+ start:3808 stop:4155 length:348 start_codon:yes stop_codon:yes gene_type:complete
MKMLMTMLAMMLVAVGCGDSDDPVVEAPAEDAVSEVAESDAEVVSDVVSEEDVSTLDVEADAEEEADAPEEADVEEQVEEQPAEESEDDQAMNGDPTRFGGDNFSTEFVPAAQVP